MSPVEHESIPSTLIVSSPFVTYLWRRMKASALCTRRQLGVSVGGQGGGNFSFFFVFLRLFPIRPSLQFCFRLRQEIVRPTVFANILFWERKEQKNEHHFDFTIRHFMNFSSYRKPSPHPPLSFSSLTAPYRTVPYLFQLKFKLIIPHTLSSLSPSHTAKKKSFPPLAFTSSLSSFNTFHNTFDTQYSFKGGGEGGLVFVEFECIHTYVDDWHYMYCAVSQFSLFTPVLQDNTSYKCMDVSMCVREYGFIPVFTVRCSASKPKSLFSFFFQVRINYSA